MGGIGSTVVALAAELSPGLGSLGLPATLAVLLNAPTKVGVTMMVTVALAPFARLPKKHVTVAVPLQPPWLAAADTKTTPLGRGSATVTPAALFKPLFLTVSV